MFSDSDWGIIGTGNLHTCVVQNEFSDLARRGVSLENNQSSAIDIRVNNVFTGVNTGIWIRDIQNCNVNNSGNDKENSYYFSDPGLSFNKSASTLQNPIEGNNLVHIWDIEIEDYRLGIHASNTAGIAVGLDDAGNVSGNTVSFHPGATPVLNDYHSGIWLQNCPRAIIAGNEIANNATVTSPGITNFTGIDVEQSTDCAINCNDLANLSYSMQFTGFCDGTTEQDSQGKVKIFTFSG